MNGIASNRPLSRRATCAIRRTLAALVLCAACAVALVGCGGTDANSNAKGADTAATGSDPEPVTLIGADSTGKGAAGQLFGEYVAQRVSEITDGRFTIDYHPNGDLGGDADLLRQVQAGDIALVVCQTAPTVSFIPEMAVFDLPMAFSKYSGDTIDAVLNGDNEFTERLDAAYEKAGLHLLGFLQNATYRLTTSNSDLSDIGDFAGLQIRTMENKNHMAFWTAIGAEPTPLAWAEVYIALQNGTIAAQENAADTIVGASLNEVQKYLACTNHILYCNQICVNKDVYESLDPTYRAALDQAVAEAIAYLRPQLAGIDKDNKDKLVAAGMTLIEYDNAFYDGILASDGVKALYADIDENQVDGLATVLVNELSK